MPYLKYMWKCLKIFWATNIIKNIYGPAIDSACLHAILKGRESSMAAMSFSSVSLRPPELSPATSYHRSSAASLLRRRPLSISCATASPETSTAPPEKPEIELEFLGVWYNSFSLSWSLFTLVLSLIWVYSYLLEP